MFPISEQLFTVPETRKLLRIGKLRYAELIERGLLDKPVRSGQRGWRYHTSSQIERFQQRLRDLATPTARSAKLTIKPLSARHRAELRG